MSKKSKLSISFSQDTREKVAPIPEAPVSRTSDVIDEKDVTGESKLVCY